MTCHCIYQSRPPLRLDSTAGLVPEGHRILVYGQELEKEVDLLDTFRGEFRECICLYFLLVYEPRFTELGLGLPIVSVEGLTRLAIKIQFHLYPPFFAQSADNPSQI